MRGLQSGGRDIHAWVSLAEFVAQLRAEPVARYGAGGHRMRPNPRVEASADSALDLPLEFLFSVGHSPALPHACR